DAGGSWVCNTLWMLDDVTADNGALRVVPGSHRAGRLPAEALADPSAAHPDQIVLTGRAGDVLVLDAHLWHGGLANPTDRPRPAPPPPRPARQLLPPGQAAAAVPEGLAAPRGPGAAHPAPAPDLRARRCAERRARRGRVGAQRVPEVAVARQGVFALASRKRG